MSDWIVCSRCGRDATPNEMREAATLGIPREWEGPPPVCPACQYAEWHPHCTSVRVESGFGARVDIEALERGEPVAVEIGGVPVLLRTLSDLKALPMGELGRCDYIDLSVSWVDNEDWPRAWTCSECGRHGLRRRPPRLRGVGPEGRDVHGRLRGAR